MCVGVCLWGRGSDRRRSETTGGQVEEMKHRKGGLGGGDSFWNKNGGGNGRESSEILFTFRKITFQFQF